MKTKKRNKGSKVVVEVEKWDLVEIEWRDACRQRTTWMLEEEFDYKDGDKFSSNMKTVGYVTRVTEPNVYIAQQWSKCDGGISNLTSIPKVNIIKLRILRKHGKN